MSSLRKHLFLGFLLAACVLQVRAQTPQDDSWNRVLTQEDRAFDLLDREEKTGGSQQRRLTQERQIAFRETAARLSEYTGAFIKDPKSVSAVNAMFRMGYYLELGSWDQDALVYYRNCLIHPRVSDSGAVFGKDQKPLRPQVEKRIADLTVRMTQAGTPGTTTHTLYVLARFSGKGSMGGPGLVSPPDPLGDQDALAVAQRLSFPSDLSRARQDWRRLLEQDPDLLPIAEDSSVPGLLVFGIKGTPEATKSVASTLDFYRKDLMNRYFDSGLPGPTMVVFANLAKDEERIVASAPAQESRLAEERTSPVQQNPAQQSPVQQSQAQQSPAQRSAQQRPLQSGAQRPGQESVRTTVTTEDIARKLSNKLHFRSMSETEGYFEPLDHTLVLRRNLVGADGQIFLGTGLHELTHALIRVDFPRAPVWLNEGLSAVHEEYGKDGPIDNYRLYVAKAAIQKGGRWPTVSNLINARQEWWTGEARTVMAAASRYFCIFLFKQGQLDKVYRALRDAPAGEPVPTTLRRVTGKSVDQLNREWLKDIDARNEESLDARWSSLQSSIRSYIAGLQELERIR